MLVLNLISGKKTSVNLKLLAVSVKNACINSLSSSDILFEEIISVLSSKRISIILGCR